MCIRDRTQGYATFRDGERVFQQAGFEPKVAMQVKDIFTLLSMVSSGVGYALLPGRVAAVYENRVKLIPLQAKYHLQQHIGVVFLKAKERDVYKRQLRYRSAARRPATRNDGRPRHAPVPVSYTHLDVYKRQGLPSSAAVTWLQACCST